MNNRDRHAARCEGDLAGAKEPPAAVPDHELQLEPVTRLTGHEVPKSGSEECTDAIADPDPVSNPTQEVRPSPFGELTSSVMRPEEPSVERADTVPASSLQLVGPFEGSVYDYTLFEQMLASPPSHHSFPSVAQGQPNAAYSGGLTNHQSVQHLVRPTTLPDGSTYSSRKRAVEGTMIHASKRHRSESKDVGNISASFNSTETHPGIAGPFEVSIAEASENTTSREINTVLEPVIAYSQLPVPATVILADNENYASCSSTLTSILAPIPLKPQTHFEYISYSRTVSGSPHIVERIKIVAVKTTFPIIGGRRERTHDHHKWIRTLTRKPRKVTDATSLWVNDILVSKKTRFPRVRNQ